MPAIQDLVGGNPFHYAGLDVEEVEGEGEAAPDDCGEVLGAYGQLLRGEAPALFRTACESGTLALAVILCALGVVGIGLYPKPIVMAALRVAAPLF